MKTVTFARDFDYVHPGADPETLTAYQQGWSGEVDDGVEFVARTAGALLLPAAAAVAEPLVAPDEAGR